MATERERLRLGRIGRPQGVKGSVRVDDPAPWYPFVPGSTVIVGGEPRRIAGRGRAGGQTVLAFEGVVDRDGAAALRGLPLELDRADAPPPEEDAFWISDLVGCEVWCEGARLGEVREVLERPANDVLVVGTDADDLLLPFTRDACPAVDIAGRRIELRAGLLEPE